MPFLLNYRKPDYLFVELTLLLTIIRQGTPAYTLFATAPPSEKQKGRDKEPDFTATLMCLIRLVDQKTDIVVVMNVPHIPGQYDNASVDPSIGKMGELLQKGMDARSKLIETFEINDWDLFVQE